MTVATTSGTLAMVVYPIVFIALLATIVGLILRPTR